MKNLMIVESPNKIKKLKEILGSDWEVIATYGHIMDLPSNPKDGGIGINEYNFEAHYEVIKGKEKVISNIVNSAKRASNIYIATDPDREGEAIAWHVSNILPKNKPYKRVTFNAITKNDVLNGIKKARGIDLNLKNAQEARRILDRIIGYKLSPLLTQYAKQNYNKQNNEVFSVGRVQTPAVKIIKDRTKEIREFKPVPYWTIEAKINYQGVTFKAVHPKNYKNKQEAINLLNSLGNNFRVKDIKKFEVLSKPPMPFTTATLQQTAHTVLGFTPAKTMAVAQELYASGKITYLRTDSPWISDDGLMLSEQFIKNTFGDKYYNKRNYAAIGIAQEAHECIRPTHLKETTFANKDEELLYNLIARRFFASQMSDAKYYKVEVLFDNNGTEFKAVGRTLLFDGFQRMLNLEESNPEKANEIKEEKMPVEIGNINVSDNVIMKGNAYLEENKTKPPAYFNDATLVKELEKNGIGRPSTYASIINNIKMRGYIAEKDDIQEDKNGQGNKKSKKKSSKLVATEKSLILEEFIDKMFPELHNLSYTKAMEKDLDLIASGEKDKKKILKNVLESIKKIPITIPTFKQTRKQ